jgi:hypothetical protein
MTWGGRAGRGIGLDEAHSFDVSMDDVTGLANVGEGGVGCEASGGISSGDVRTLWWMTSEKCQRYAQKP